MLSRRLAELEGAESALVLASGMAATACTLLALLRSGDHLLACSWLAPETRDFCEHALPSLGIQVSFVDPRETRGWRRALTRTTRAMFVESPVVATTRILDLRPPRALAQELGIALIVDATAASPCNFRPLAHGADVVVHDGRAFLSDDAGPVGVVSGSDALIDEVRTHMHRWGAMPHPAAQQGLARGLHTLDARVQRQNANAQRLAEWAEQQPIVRAVHYPGLASHPDRALAAEMLTGGGATLILDLATTDAARAACALPSDDRGADVPLPDHGAALASRIERAETPTTVRVRAGVESSDTMLAWLAARLS